MDVWVWDKLTGQIGQTSVQKACARKNLWNENIESGFSKYESAWKIKIRNLSQSIGLRTKICQDEIETLASFAAIQLFRLKSVSKETELEMRKIAAQELIKFIKDNGVSPIRPLDEYIQLAINGFHETFGRNLVIGNSGANKIFQILLRKMWLFLVIPNDPRFSPLITSDNPFSLHAENGLSALKNPMALFSFPISKNIYVVISKDRPHVAIQAIDDPDWVHALNFLTATNAACNVICNNKNQLLDLKRSIA